MRRIAFIRKFGSKISPAIMGLEVEALREAVMNGVTLGKILAQYSVSGDENSMSTGRAAMLGKSSQMAFGSCADEPSTGPLKTIGSLPECSRSGLASGVIRAQCCGLRLPYLKVGLLLPSPPPMKT